MSSLAKYADCCDKLSDYILICSMLQCSVLFLASGNVIDHVIIERESESTVMFVEGAKDAYLGYVTLRVSIYCKF